MRNPRLFTDQPLTPGDQVVLKGNVAQHLGRVLRSAQETISRCSMAMVRSSRLRCLLSAKAGSA